MSANEFVAEIESRIDAFEAAKCLDPATEITEFLPPRTHPSYREDVLELLRVDLELSWKYGESKTVEDYRDSFSEILSDNGYLNDIAFEEYRLRWQHGEKVDRATFAQRLGVDADTWPVLIDSTEATHANSEPPAQTSTEMPQPGESFLGFDILEEIGSGAVGRVFLAKQTGLAERLVVLKCSKSFWHESDRMARLQHTNIVPIHSIHRVASLQAICMPYFGKTTLEKAIKQLHDPQCQASDPLARNDVSGWENNGSCDIRASNSTETGFATLTRQGTKRDFEIRCLRLIGKLAEGLDHAHHRGIWHQDIKPANVLLADHGQPMLLDFNLARESTDHAALATGGTPAYMAPEQIEGLKVRANIGPWSDVYGLGVVLFEMLTGSIPFKSRPGGPSEDWSTCIRERETPPNLRTVDPEISPAVASIVQRCLTPQPKHRYQSAADLVQDINLHLNDLPLRHAPNISWRERVTKWLRRHPRMTSATTVTAVAATCIAIVGVLTIWQDNEVRRLNGVHQIEQLHSVVEQSGAALTVPNTSAELVSEARSHLEQVIADIGVTPETWRDWPAFSALGEAHKQRFGTTLGHAFYLLANTSSSSNKPETIQNALRLNLLAEDAFSLASVPQAVYLQRTSLGGSVGEDRLLQADVTNASARDLALQAGEQMRNAQYQDALDLLLQAQKKSPRDFNVSLLLGNCHYALGNASQAILDFTAAASLWPESHIPHFYRGLARLENGDFNAAVEDFDRVLEIRPASVAALMNRALASIKQDRWQAALADLNRVIDSGAAPTRAYFLRSKVRKRVGDLEGAQQDREDGFRFDPVDEADYIARAVARLPDDPKRCKAELDEVLQSNPLSTRALQNLAHVCSEHLDSPQEAIGYLDRLLAIRATDRTARAGRGVLLARLGKVAESLRDAETVSNPPVDATTAYQLACLCALNVPADESCETRALTYLAEAIRQDTRWSKIAPTDRDLESLHGKSEFRRLVAAGTLLNDPLQKK